MRIISYIVLFFISLIAFLPQENIFFEIQKLLSKNKIYINVDSFNNKPYTLHLRNVKIYYNNVNFLDVDEIKTLLFFIFNKIQLENIKLNFQNLKINILNIKYNLFDPYEIIINGISNFGNIDGYINLKNKKGKIYILNLKNNNLKYFLKKDQKGYFYEILY